MVNLSARKYTSYFKAFHEQQSLGRMLLLATAAHLLLLFSLEGGIKPLISAQKMMATALDVSLYSSVNEEDSLHVAKQNSQPTELIGPIVSLQQALPTAKETPSKESSQPPLQMDPLALKTLTQQATQPPTLTRRRTVSAAAHESKDAAYLARWQSYVEEFGNRHYPQAALKNNLRGELRLLVAVKKDGTVHEVSIRQSSGHVALDQAAIEIVHNAAPFEPLPNEIAADIEILEIIRTWQFRGKLSTSV